jgi:hypothetical protein
MSSKKILLLLITLAGYSVAVQARCNVVLKMAGASDSLVSLIRYTAGGRTIFQSKRADNKGMVVFEDQHQNLAVGMYVVAACGEEFPFLVSNNENFELTIEADSDNAENTKYGISKENEFFLKYLGYQKKYNAILQNVQSNYGRSSDNVRTEIDGLLDTLRAEQRHFVEIITGSHPKSLLASVIMASQVPELSKADGTANDSLQWHRWIEFIKVHFFDNVDFNDNRLINTPVLSARLTTFFKEIMARAPIPDIIETANALLVQVDGNREMYQYILTWLYQTYNRSPIEGHSAVGKVMTNLMADSTKVDWLSAADKAELQKNVKRYALNPEGCIAADLVLQTPNGTSKQLHIVEAPCTLLYFFDPECQACRVITPLLYSLFLHYKEKGLQIFAVYPERNREAWVQYISDNGFGDFINVWDADGTANIHDKYSLYAIPQIYVLDESKKILHKDVSIDDLQHILFITFLEKDGV